MIVGMVVLLLGVGAATPERNQRVWLVSLLGTIIALVASLPKLLIATLSATTMPSSMYFGGGIVADNLSSVFDIVLALAAFLAILMADRYLAEKHLAPGEFYALILLSASGGMVMAHAFDLMNIFVGLEVLSVALYILAGFARRELRSEEAAVKYFLLGAFASGFLLFGCALIYGSVGITIRENHLAVESPASFTNLYRIASTLSATHTFAHPLASQPLFIAGAVLVIIGLCFKASIVPFHSYAPDVYEGSPIPVTAFMSSAAKAGAFAAFLRFYVVLLDGGAGVGPYKTLLWVLAAATMVVGNVMAVRQINIKRMLAYSSIAHAGYLLVGLLAASPAQTSILMTKNTMSLSVGSVGFYLLVYTFMNLGAFSVLMWLGRERGREYANISDLAGLAKRQPLAAGIMTVFLLSLAGIPPAAGFFGKMYLFLAAVNSGYVGLAALGLIASVIGAFYYLSVIVSMFFREPENSFTSANVRGGAFTAALIAAIATLLLGLIPIPSVTPHLQKEGLSQTSDDISSKLPAIEAPATSASPSMKPRKF